MEMIESLRRYWVATTETSPEPEPGVTWIWAKNGIFKRGVDATLDLCVWHLLIGMLPEVPGLYDVASHVRWRGIRTTRMPGVLLQCIFQHAVGVGRSEQQYYLVWTGGKIRWMIPEQVSSGCGISYRVPDVPILVDIHSHHFMKAYFSETDDRDDTGLSVSCVIGNFGRCPTVVCRLNVYGHHQMVPATMVFDSIGELRDGWEG